MKSMLMICLVASAAFGDFTGVWSGNPELVTQENDVYRCVSHITLEESATVFRLARTTDCFDHDGSLWQGMDMDYPFWIVDGKLMDPVEIGAKTWGTISGNKAAITNGGLQLYLERTERGLEYREILDDEDDGILTISGLLTK